MSKVKGREGVRIPVGRSGGDGATPPDGFELTEWELCGQRPTLLRQADSAMTKSGLPLVLRAIQPESLVRKTESPTTGKDKTMPNDNRSTAWSLTLNNPTAEDEEQINIARQQGWKVEGQKEKGESGTEHYQLMVKTPQVRFSSVKKMFPRAHIEPARNIAALTQYVVKESTRVGDLPTQQSLYPSLSRFWELLAEELNAMEFLNWNYLVEPTTRSSSEVWWKETPRSVLKDPLIALDWATEALIHKGYRVEGIACNPSTRLAWKKFHSALLCRAYTHRQTDRQDSRVQSAEDGIAVVNIPTNADDYSRQEAPSRILGEDHDGQEASGNPSPSEQGTDRSGPEDC